MSFLILDLHGYRAGFRHFQRFFSSYYIGRLIGNTVGISLYALALGFPIPILLALLINEIRSRTYQKVVQNITYIPYFLYACIKANFDVAYRVLHPHVPIRPGIVTVRTTLQSDLA